MKKYLFMHNKMKTPMYISAIIAFGMAAALIMAIAPACSLDTLALLLKVDQSGNGDYTRIQDAIDAVPSNNSAMVFISISPGIYREEIIVPVDKPFITLSGLKANSTIITSSGGGTIWYATVSILASNFVGRYLTIQNTYGPGAQAVALRVTGDQAAFYACRFIGYQDTLFDHTGRHYYSNCHIEGATDFIFGDGLSLFEKCRIHSVSKKGGAITAQRRSSPTDNTGYSFINCKITGRGSTILGRPWGPYSRVVFAYTYMSRVIAPQGWNDWGNPLNQKTAFYGQYKCYGPGSSLSKRARWARALSYEEAAPFLTHSMIDGQQWLRPMPSLFKRPIKVKTLDGNY